MKIKTSEIISLIIVLFITGLSLYLYRIIPEQMVAYWNAQGEADGYLPKSWGLTIFPAIMLFLFLLFLIIPRIDPMRENIEKFRKYFDHFIILIFAFFVYLFFLVIFWNLGYSFSFIKYLVPAFSVLFFYTGILVYHSLPNWTIGIRTPWTLSSASVWRKTNQMGGWLFQFCAGAALFGVFFPQCAIWLVIVPVVSASLFTIVYSYFEFRHINRMRNKPSGE